MNGKNNETYLEFAIRRQKSSVDILVGLIRMIIPGPGPGSCCLLTAGLRNNSSVNLIRFIGIGIVIRNWFDQRFRCLGGGRSSMIIFIRFVGFERIEIRLPSVLRWLLHCWTSPSAGERIVRFDERVVIGFDERIKVVIVDRVDGIDGFLAGLNSGWNCLVTVGRRWTVVVRVLSSDIRHHDGHHTADEL